MRSIRLSKNLTRDIKRGHPWVYRKALDPKSLPKNSGWYMLEDSKRQKLAYGLYDAGSELAFRVLCVGAPKDPVQLIRDRLRQAFELRRTLKTEKTSGFRWVHGEGDLLPGLVVDVFGETAVVQCDGEQLYKLWDPGSVAGWLKEIHSGLTQIVWKPQAGKGSPECLWGEQTPVAEFEENGVRWTADVYEGQKTGFFLDQRENRHLVRRLASGKTVLNLFCYTGGFSVAAGVGGASRVVSVDISNPAIEACKQHWLQNSLEPSKHRALAQNVFDYLENEPEQFDMVVVDPPAFASSRAALEKARLSYEKVFREAAKKVKPGGLLALSSCSRPVDFETFSDIVVQSLSKARRVGQTLSISGQPFDHPFPHVCPELRYLKFFLLRLPS